jgi:UDP-2,4-diacetamido-2,4,6-trideoxy-beta-L-altropyranose hydrolase
LRIAFRADATRFIGTGHVMRCLTLADVLSAMFGARCVFASRGLGDSLRQRIEGAGHHVLSLPAARTSADLVDGPPYAAWLGASQAEDAAHTVAALAGGADGLVVDHYGLDARWAASVHSALGVCMLAIDDLADRPLRADLLLDQTLQAAGPSRWDSLVAGPCERLLGPGFALLRPEFARARREEVPGPPRVFVFLSGSDPDNHTGALAESLARHLSSDVQVEIVVGALHPDVAALTALCARRAGWSLASDVRDMAARMVRAHLAIGTGGSTTWERCAVGLPSVLTCIADNQAEIVRRAAEAGVAVDVGDGRTVPWDHVARAADELLRAPHQLAVMRRRCLALVDGHGAERVARRFGACISRSVEGA